MGAFSGTLPKDELLQPSSRGKFIRSLSTGQVTKEQFNEWLAQEYLITVNYKSYISHIRSCAPRLQHDIWDDAMALGDREINWIESKLKERGIVINDIKPLPSTLTDQQLLNDLIQTNKSYLSLVTAVYAIEFSSYEAWKSVKNPDYEEFIERWGSKAVKETVEDIQTLVDIIAKLASENNQIEAREVWRSIIKTEANFSNVKNNEISS